MQGHYKSCILQEKLTDTQLILETQDDDILTSLSVDVFGMAELVAGYMDCMEEALRYLKDVEQYSEDHPAVLGLRQHLSIYQQQLITETIHIKENIPSSLSHSENRPTSLSHSENIPTSLSHSENIPSSLSHSSVKPS